VTDPGGGGDAGVPWGAELLAFASAAQEGTTDLAAARTRVIEVLGPGGAAEAAATVAVFNGLVRVADGTGIQLDAGLAGYSADLRDELGIDAYAGAANGAAAGADAVADGSDVMGLFR
jgi:type IV pilus biogenesis protein CpaD/CtpE